LRCDRLLESAGLLLLFLAAATAASAASVAAARSTSGETITWMADPADPTGSAVVLSVQSPEPFIHLFLYPNGNFAISGIDQPACDTFMGAAGPGDRLPLRIDDVLQGRLQDRAADPGRHDGEARPREDRRQGRQRPEEDRAGRPGAPQGEGGRGSRRTKALSGALSGCAP
jgi:hypothetical protein